MYAGKVGQWGPREREKPDFYTPRRISTIERGWFRGGGEHGWSVEVARGGARKKVSDYADGAWVARIFHFIAGEKKVVSKKEVAYIHLPARWGLLPPNLARARA